MMSFDGLMNFQLCATPLRLPLLSQFPPVHTGPPARARPSGTPFSYLLVKQGRAGGSVTLGLGGGPATARLNSQSRPS